MPIARESEATVHVAELRRPRMELRRTAVREFPSTDPATDVSFGLLHVLRSLGVELAFGLTGGALAYFCHALGQSAIRMIHCRHEGGAAFAATEAFFASGKPTVVYTTTGPGLTNAITGLLAARTEGAKVIVISAVTPAAARGRGACQESTMNSMLPGLYTAGPLFDYAVMMENPNELATVAARLAAGVSRPGGFVAHVAIPTDIQSAKVAELPKVSLKVAATGCDPELLDECAAKLTSAPFAIWVGFGAREAADSIRTLAERTGAPVMCSPRGKGIFPENHPQFLGVTGMGGHQHVTDYLAQHRPAHILVLGTRLGEPTSYWDEKLLPTEALIHVDIDPDVPGSAYPRAPTYAVQAEIGAFVKGLLERMPERPPAETDHNVAPVSVIQPKPRTAGPVRAAALMKALQRQVVDATDALVLAEAGNAFAWTNHLLRFDVPKRYRVSVGTGSMGHATTGVVGAALARKGKAVAVVGDGSMLMNSEVSTAVACRVPAVWVVMNDSRYGMVEHGMRALGMAPSATDIPVTDFAMNARSMGADGIRVEREEDLDAALAQAMAAEGPFVVDVRTDATEAGPWIKRIENLILQGASRSRKELT